MNDLLRTRCSVICENPVMLQKGDCLFFIGNDSDSYLIHSITFNRIRFVITYSGNNKTRISMILSDFANKISSKIEIAQGVGGSFKFMPHNAHHEKINIQNSFNKLINSMDVYGVYDG